MKELIEKYFSSIKKLMPEKEFGASVGLDIGKNACKMVEITKTGDSFQLTNWAIEPVKNDDIKNAIRRCLSKLKVPVKLPYTAVLGKGTLIRYINMPKMNLVDLKKSIALEADRHFPFPKDHIYTDCHILDSKLTDNKMLVLVAAARKELIDGRIALLTELGYQADFVGLNPIALANALSIGQSKETSEEGKEQPEQKATEAAATAILDFGESASNLVIFVDGVPRFARDIYVGGTEISNRISNALSVAGEETEKIKHNPGKRYEEVFSACESALMTLITEIRLSFDYFTTEHNIHVNKVLLTGGASLFEGMSDFFEKNLDVKVENWNPLDAIEVHPDISAKDVHKNSARLSVALGLALYQYR